MRNFVINAFWDDEAQVWVAESTDVPGLCTEANSLELLSQKIQIMIPELLEEMPKNARIRLEARRDFALTAA
jgi:predicted RNase H-like HicB family nuclease